MAKPGRRRTPTKILAARGSWLAKTRTGEPQAEGEPTAPVWLKGDALMAWNALLPMLASMGIIGTVDTNAIARYCQLFARWRECEDFISKHGATVAQKNAAGQVEVKEFPQVGRASKLADQLLRLEGQFGMTPSARASLAIQQPKKDRERDGIQNFINPKLVG